MYIVVEGVDYSGKSTVVKSLTELLTKEGYDVLAVREPGSTPLGEDMRELAFSIDFMAGYAECVSVISLMMSSRLLLMDRIVEHMKKPNAVVISDRSVITTFVMQIYPFIQKYPDRDMESNLLDLFQVFMSAVLRPDMIFILDQLKNPDDRQESNQYDEYRKKYPLKEIYATIAHWGSRYNIEKLPFERGSVIDLLTTFMVNYFIEEGVSYTHRIPDATTEERLALITDSMHKRNMG